jgi:hypothetical protein
MRVQVSSIHPVRLRIADFGLRICLLMNLIVSQETNPQSEFRNPQSTWGCSIAANAPDCLSGHRGFESRHSRSFFTVGWLRQMSAGPKNRIGWCDANSNHQFNIMKIRLWKTDYGWRAVSNSKLSFFQPISSADRERQSSKLQVVGSNPTSAIFRFRIWDCGFAIALIFTLLD